MAALWNDLVARASPNVFMNPAALCAAADSKFADVHVLQAWNNGVTPEKLVGLWAMRLRKIAPAWPSHLEALPYEYAFLSSPVIDRAYVDEVIPAFLSAIAENRTLPKIVSLQSFDAESSSYHAILKALVERGGKQLELSEFARAVVTRDFGVKRSGSTRKKLRQDWNRLCALGAVDTVNDRTSAGVQQAFETFLRLEAGSWKGAEGTAILSDAKDASFVRRLIGALIEQGNVSVALLRVDGRAIAAQVLMYCGSAAYTWKTAFDSEFARYSPGALLVDKVTEELFSVPGIDAIDSCSPEASFMTQLWSGRRKMVDLLVNLGAGKSLGFTLETGRQRGYRRLRDLRRLLQAINWTPRPKKAASSAPR
jgi:CelD/BcsL family acetyltransferase involved in cellulose biosynthesis